MLLGSITGKDPRLLGGEEEAASELGLSPEVAVKLQAIAARTLNGSPCDAPFEQPS